MKEPPHIPLAKLQKLSLESKRKREKIKKTKTKTNKKKSQKILKNSSLAKIFFFFKNIHNFIRANTNSKIQNTQETQNTHTKRPTSGDALPQRGACRERVHVPEEREREILFRAVEFASKQI
jgi:hypothetical protein